MINLYASGDLLAKFDKLFLSQIMA